jgi:hypothetical protein
MEWFQENEWIIDRATGHDVCVMDDECGTKEQRAKNAALIAAAPDLLAALKLAFASANGARDIDSYAEIGWEAIDAIEAAIAKAEGGAR